MNKKEWDDLTVIEQKIFSWKNTCLRKLPQTNPICEGIVDILEELQKIQEAQKPKEKVCKWTCTDIDIESDYETNCGNAWSFLVGGVAENSVEYCMYCGGKIEGLK